MSAAAPLLTVLVDTNVLIAAMLGSRTARAALRAITNTPSRWITSPLLLDELIAVPRRPKFHGVITASAIRRMMRQLQRHATLIHPHTVVQACRDPHDDHVLAAAVDGRATYLVTADRDLLVLTPFRGVAIVTAGEFLARVKSSEARLS